MSDKAFSSMDLVGQCLLDKPRTEMFRRAIKDATGPRSVVLDAGTGSGILTLFAAKAGASKVFSVELDPFIAKTAKNNININGYSKIIKIIKQDTRKLDLKSGTHFDIVIMEMLTTGMIDESQIECLLNLKKKKYVSEKTVYIPTAQQSFATFGKSNYELYGLKMPMILHLWDIHTQYKNFFENMSTKIMYDDYNFKKVLRKKVDTIIESRIEKDGVVDSILLESRTVLNENLSLEETPALNGKVLIPIEAKNVVTGDIIRGKISYVYGGGFETLKFKYLND